MTPADEREWEHGGDDALAAEYVLGALPADERRAAAARIEREPEFARLVDAWELRLSPMADGYAEIEPPARVQQAIDARLFAASAEPGRRPPFWSRIGFWQSLAAAAIISHLVYVAAPLILPSDVETGERYVASLAPQDSEVHYFVVYDERTQDVGLSHVTGARAEGHDFELWVIEGDNPPASLGVIPAGSSVHLAVDEEMRERIESGAVFAISLEPEGGSPTGLPTGPVVAAGDLKEI